MLKRLAVLIITLSAVCSLHAQSFPGQAIATQYAQWRVPSYSPNSYSFPPTVCNVSLGKQSVAPIFATNAPIKIIDPDPSMTETVTPAGVMYNQQACAINIAPTHQHSSFNLVSGTCGLQESINAQQGAPTVVIITPDFTTPLGCSTSTITSAQGSTAVSILDERNAVIVPYIWNGSAYVANPFGAGGGVNPGQHFFIPAYAVGGTNVGPITQMFVDATGNNIFAPSFNTVVNPTLFAGADLGAQVATAATACGNNCTIDVPTSSWTLSASATGPANIRLKFEAGALCAARTLPQYGQSNKTSISVTIKSSARRAISRLQLMAISRTV